MKINLLKYRRIVFLSFFFAVACSSKKGPEPLNQKASTQYQFAYDAYVQGDLIPALSAALQATELSPNNPDARNLLGLIYFRQQKYAQSEVSFKEAVALEPKLSEAWNNLGTLYYEQKRFTEAKQVLEKALENPLYLYPDRIYNNLGLVEESLGNQPAAIEAYNRSIQIQRDFYLPFQNLGKLYFKEKNNKRAKGLLEEAIRLCPDCSEPRYFLGQVLLKDNQTTEALKVFKEGAATDPRGYYGQLCREFLVKEQ